MQFHGSARSSCQVEEALAFDLRPRPELDDDSAAQAKDLTGKGGHPLFETVSESVVE
jgi:hypothetical protein